MTLRSMEEQSEQEFAAVGKIVMYLCTEIHAIGWHIDGFYDEDERMMKFRIVSPNNKHGHCAVMFAASPVDGLVNDYNSTMRELMEVVVKARREADKYLRKLED